MNNNNLSTITDQQTITSMEIAEITGKHHYDVMKAIRKMEPAWHEAGKGNFSLSYRTVDNQVNRQYPYYILTKTECLFIATKFNDVARAKLVLRWDQLEKERLTQANLHSEETNLRSSQFNEKNSSANLPVDPRNMSRLQILQLALEAEQENERLRDQVSDLEADNYGLMIDLGQKDQEIEHLKERTAYLDVIDCQRDTVTTSQIAQDYGQSAVTFNNLLKGLRIQRRIGEQWILYADFLNKGYVANRMVPIHHSGGPDTFKPLTVWTAAGRKFLYQKLKKHGVLPMIERTALSKEGGVS